MMLAGRDHDCLSEMLIVAAALSVHDPRDRPAEAQAAADNAHKKFADEKSEFLSYLKIWKWFEEAIDQKKSNRQLQEQCRENFLSQMRLREWRDVHSQLFTLVREQGWRMNEATATYEQLHLALLTGLLGNVGYKSDDEPLYLGARGIRFHLWPGSSLSKKAGRWVVAGELVETSRLFARTIANMQPEWLERVGGHLLKKSWGDPRWEKRVGRCLPMSEPPCMAWWFTVSVEQITEKSNRLKHVKSLFAVLWCRGILKPALLFSPTIKN
jgi:ATP-dependent helicase HrpA